MLSFGNSRKPPAFPWLHGIVKFSNFPCALVMKPSVLPVVDYCSRSLFLVNILKFRSASALAYSTAVCQQCFYLGYILGVFLSCRSGNTWHLTRATQHFVELLQGITRSTSVLDTVPWPIPIPLSRDNLSSSLNWCSTYFIQNGEKIVTPLQAGFEEKGWLPPIAPAFQAVWVVDGYDCNIGCNRTLEDKIPNLTISHNS